MFPIFPRPIKQGSPKKRATDVEVKSSKFNLFCHGCGVYGHFKNHNHKQPSCEKFVFICHHCGVEGHIRPHCLKLHGYAYKKIEKNVIFFF